ncbi:copper resistance CopC family protein [Methylococcus mesophilus]|uniref:copper resistance CopC family protein n=1 Tax=Methylococcus mesophilus TaxID=2993564 RepID=UPI00224AF6C3|nr:copper resistance CopC family protein [Methylococcus mesophilus]UZR28919.1 copper resistance protein CopC [Methylococcus mesophilus]
MRKPIPSLAATLAGLVLAGAAGAAEDGSLAAANPFLARTVDTPVHLAHAILVKAIPDRDATITDVPEEVLLTFNEGVGNDFLALAVVDGEGKRVDNHDAKLDFTDRSKLRTSVSKLTPGRYMVRYRVLSADGHVVSGKYFFQVQTP